MHSCSCTTSTQPPRRPGTSFPSPTSTHTPPPHQGHMFPSTGSDYRQSRWHRPERLAYMSDAEMPPPQPQGCGSKPRENGERVCGGSKHLQAHTGEGLSPKAERPQSCPNCRQAAHMRHTHTQPQFTGPGCCKSESSVTQSRAPADALTRNPDR